MARFKLRDLLILGGGVALFAWATLPPDKVALDPDCAPAGGPATLGAALYGRWFWQGQLDAVAAERLELLTQPARRARADAELEREMRDNPALEERMMRLSREQGRIDDKAEKERRDAQAQSRRLGRIVWLDRCDAVIRQKLAP